MRRSEDQPMNPVSVLAAAALLPFGSAATAQPVTVANPQKPISRSDFIKILDNRFNSIDTNHDGKISREELIAAQQRDLAAANARIRQQLEAKFRQLDTNHDGSLSLQEFMALAPAIKTTETPDEMLKRLDKNHDGTVSLEEFRAADLAKFDAADTNHDGVVTPAEAQAYARAHPSTAAH
jgi:Ca2+-binding EF-hand superfamily protein